MSANSAGSLSINGAGDVQVATVNGIGDVSGAASLDITTANGDITAKTIAGDVKLAKGTNFTVNGAGGNNPKATCDNETMSPEMLGDEGLKDFFALDESGLKFVFLYI